MKIMIFTSGSKLTIKEPFNLSDLYKTHATINEMITITGNEIKLKNAASNATFCMLPVASNIIDDIIIIGKDKIIIKTKIDVETINQIFKLFFIYFTAKDSGIGFFKLWNKPFKRFAIEFICSCLVSTKP